MRNYGRFLKNTAGVLLFFALLSLLLPFCYFVAAGQQIALSGMDVLTAAGKAGYTYLTQGQLTDDFVLKAPLTVGTMKSALTFVWGNVDSRLLAAGAAAVLLPLLFCFLAMCMLFVARGKKTMVMPTVFTLIVLAEMLVAVFGLSELHPYLWIGVYLFTLLHGIALLLILIGWVTGGYRRPEEKSKASDSHERSRGKSHHKWPRRKLFHKKKSRKKRKSKKQPAKKDKESAYVWNDCSISYDATSKTYQIVNNSSEDILIYKDDTVIGGLKSGGKVCVEDSVTLQRKGSTERLKLK